MKVICAWCEPAISGPDIVSHGMCDKCAEGWHLEIDQRERDKEIQDRAREDADL